MTLSSRLVREGEERDREGKGEREREGRRGRRERKMEREGGREGGRERENISRHGYICY